MATMTWMLVCVIGTQWIASLAAQRPSLSSQVSPTIDGGASDGAATNFEVRMQFPNEDTLIRSPALFRCSVQRERVFPTAEVARLEQTASHVCVEIDGVPARCHSFSAQDVYRLGGTYEVVFPTLDLDDGNYTARCYVGCDANDAEVRAYSSGVRFSVVPATTPLARAANGFASHPSRFAEASPAKSPMLVVGVKTSVARNFAARQAIRQTWASKTRLPGGVRVLFLGCRHSFEPSAHHLLTYATELERQIYGDLLVDELDDCEDGYFGLIGKTTAFFRFVSTHYPGARFAMVADDDIYVDMNRLLQLIRQFDDRECVYAGQVWEDQFKLRVEPARDTNSQYYVSETEYALDFYPPFAFGPHYLVSKKCLHLVQTNQRILPTVGRLDDVSIAMWLRASGIRPLHVPQFRDLRDTMCSSRDDVISLADLSTKAIRVIDENLAAGRPFCDKLDLSSWLK